MTVFLKKLDLELRTINMIIKQQADILRKTIEGNKNYFDCNTFEKIISKQDILVSNRNTILQFSKMQNQIYGSLATIPYHAKSTHPR